MRNFLLLLLGILFISCSGSKDKGEAVEVLYHVPVDMKYGIEVDKYDIEPGEVKKGDFFGFMFFIGF